MRQLVVDVNIALTAQPVSLGVGGINEPGGFAVGGLNHLGRRHHPLLFLDALLDGVLVGDVAALDQTISLGLGPHGRRLVITLGCRGQPDRLLASLADHALAVRTGFGDHPVGLRFGIREQPVRLATGMAEHGLGFGVGIGDRGVGVFLGLVEQRVASVQHVLGIVEFAGDGVLDVIDKFQHIAARDDTAGSHRHTAGLFDYCAQFVERFKYSVHGATLQLVGSDQCAWCYACDCGADTVCRQTDG